MNLTASSVEPQTLSKWIQTCAHVSVRICHVHKAIVYPTIHYAVKNF